MKKEKFTDSQKKEAGKRLKMCRKRAGITQERLAIDAGYENKELISLHECGKREITEEKAVIFATALSRHANGDSFNPDFLRLQSNQMTLGDMLKVTNTTLSQSLLYSELGFACILRSIDAMYTGYVEPHKQISDQKAAFQDAGDINDTEPMKNDIPNYYHAIKKRLFDYRNEPDYRDTSKSASIAYYEIEYADHLSLSKPEKVRLTSEELSNLCREVRNYVMMRLSFIDTTDWAKRYDEK